jgi:hypothetical protein
VVSGMTLLMTTTLAVSGARRPDPRTPTVTEPDAVTTLARIERGRQTFRFDTFGDEAFWGDTLRLHEAIEGEAYGGVGPGLTPRAALAAGLKIDIDALPGPVRDQLDRGAINLDEPAVTLALLKLNAVVGLTGIFSSSLSLQSIGVQCALCHSTVDDAHPSLCAGAVVPNPGTGCIGHRLDRWANRDLKVGALVALAPDLSALAALLRVDEMTVRSVLRGWGRGRFDAGLLDRGAVNLPLIPAAFGTASVKLHTWTGWLGTLPRISSDDERKTNLVQYLLTVEPPAVAVSSPRVNARPWRRTG